MKQKDRAVKCEGRFSELREFLYSEAFPTVIGERTEVTESDLQDTWELIESDVNAFDVKDPYYDSKVDALRVPPKHNHLSLVPLIEDPLHVTDNALFLYSRERGNGGDLSNYIVQMNDQPKKFLARNLGRDPHSIVIPHSGNKNLAGYAISANFGIGTVAPGGVGGSGIRSDSPFLLEIYQHPNSGPHRGEMNLASLIGFWAQNDDMIVSQMQPCRNARLPEGVDFGTASLYVAEVVARGMGFKRMLSYSARKNPLFNKYSSDWGQMGGDFVAIWDGSAKKLGMQGTRNTTYSLDLKKPNGGNGHDSGVFKAKR